MAHWHIYVHYWINIRIIQGLQPAKMNQAQARRCIVLFVRDGCTKTVHPSRNSYFIKDHLIQVSFQCDYKFALNWNWQEAEWTGEISLDATQKFWNYVIYFRQKHYQLKDHIIFSNCLMFNIYNLIGVSKRHASHEHTAKRQAGQRQMQYIPRQQQRQRTKRIPRIVLQCRQLNTIKSRHPRHSQSESRWRLNLN